MMSGSGVRYGCFDQAIELWVAPCHAPPVLAVGFGEPGAGCGQIVLSHPMFLVPESFPRPGECSQWPPTGVTARVFSSCAFPRPRLYTPELCQEKCNSVYRNVFDAYQGDGKSVYEGV